MQSLKLFGAFFAGLIVLAFAPPVLAVRTSYNPDNFDDNSPSPAWGADIAMEETTAFLTETNMHLEFTGTTTNNATILRPWIYSYGSYTQNWEVAADINLGEIPVPQNAGLQMFVAVANNNGDASFGDRVVAGISVDNNNRDYSMQSAVNGVELSVAPNYGEVETASTNGRMRIAFDASTKILAASYNGNPLGFIDVDQAGTSWGMTATSTFAVVLGGSMWTDSGTFTYSGHEVSADNFEIRTGNSLAYLLTINNGTGSGNYTNNASVSITASDAPSGQVFDRWASATQYLANATSATTTVTMPAQAISLTAVYKLTGPGLGDDFNDNVLNAGKWSNAQVLNATPTNAFLNETNARLEFTGNAEVIRPWIAGYGSYTQSWEVAMDATLGNVALSESDAYVNMNLGVFNRQDTNLIYGVVPGDLFNVALDLYRDWDGNIHRGYELTSYVNAGELSGAPNYGYVATADQQGRLKISFDAATKVLTASYNGNVVGWVDVDAPGSNWEMTNFSTFGFAIGGGAGSVNIAAGEAYADNFMTVGTVAPPQYTYVTNNGSITITGYIGSGGAATIPSTIDGLPVTSIGDYAFESRTNLTSAVIPNSVVNLGEGAFGGCTSLTNVTIGTNVTNVGYGTFASCSGLTGITIPNSTTNIGSYAFYSCTSLANVTIGNSVRSLADFGFSDCTSLTNVTIGTNVTSIGEGTFARCVGLTQVTIPNSVTSLGQGDSEFYSGVFHYCTGLTNVMIGNGVTNIGWMTFVNCTSLTSVTIGTNVTVIGGRAFFECSSLAKVIIPNSVVSIGNMAFNFCASLTNVVIGTNVTTLGSGAFGSCTSLTAVTIPASVTSYGVPFVGCNSLISIAVDGNNSIYSSLDGVVFNKTQTALIEYPGGKAGSYTIPSSVKILGPLAFHSCAKLTGISIPNSITSIGSTAFSGCFGLTNVTIPNSVTNMEYGVFFNCPGLISVTIGNGLVSMGNSVFYNCPGLTGVYFMGNAPSLGGSTVFYNANNTTVYRVSGATGWPTVPGAWAGRPTALWQPQASDADADGIPDWWEQQYFGGSTNANPNAACSNKINTVLQAYIAGINPTDPSARFKITNNVKNILQWNAVTGRVYSVYWSTNLMNGFQTLQTNYTGGAITDSTHSAAGKCFYKIDVRLAP